MLIISPSSNAQEAYVLCARLKKLPYKKIAADLKKTELACRLHYHQMTCGQKMPWQGPDQEHGENRDASSPGEKGADDLAPVQGPATANVNGSSSGPGVPKAALPVDSPLIHVEAHKQSVPARKPSLANPQQRNRGPRKSDATQGRISKPSISIPTATRWFSHTFQPHEGPQSTHSTHQHRKRRMPPPPPVTIAKRDAGNGNGNGWGNHAISPSAGGMLTPLYSPRPISAFNQRRASVLNFDECTTKFSLEHGSFTHVGPPSIPGPAHDGKVREPDVRGPHDGKGDGDDIDMSLLMDVYNGNRASFWSAIKRDYYHRKLQADKTERGEVSTKSPPSAQQLEAIFMKQTWSRAMEDKLQGLSSYQPQKARKGGHQTLAAEAAPHAPTQSARMNNCGLDNRRNTWFAPRATNAESKGSGSMSQFTLQQQHLQHRGSQRMIPPLEVITGSALPSPCTTQRRNSFLGKIMEDTSSTLTTPTTATVSRASLSTDISPTSSHSLPPTASSTSASTASASDTGRVCGIDADATNGASARRCTVSSLLNYEIQKIPHEDEISESKKG